MSDNDPLDNDPQVAAAKIKKFFAEARLAEAMAKAAEDDAETKKQRATYDISLAKFTSEQAEAIADEKRIRAREARLEVDELERARRDKDASNSENRVYDFISQVDGNAVESAMSTLARWVRRSDAPITFRLSSYGGSVIAGFVLYDYIVDYVRGKKKIHVTMIGMGAAASMGAVLLQAGDVRMMGAQAHLLIHETASLTMGQVSQLEDEVAFLRHLNERAVNIFADRAKSSKAVKPMTRTQIKARSKRKDFWVSAEDALKWGFIDAVGYEPER